MADISNALRSIGMTNNEIKIYLALLKLGPAKAGKIAKEAGLNRTGTYDALQQLLEKGVISYVIKGKVKCFQPESPRRIIDYADEQKENLNSAMPELEGLYRMPKESRNVRLYKGMKGVKTVLQDIMNSGKENCVFGSEGEMTKRMPYFAPHFTKKLEEKKIIVRSIVRKGRAVHAPKTGEARFISGGKNRESPAVTNIYGEKIAIIIWTDVPEAIIIHNRAAAESYREYFELMWKNAEKPAGEKKTRK